MKSNVLSKLYDKVFFSLYSLWKVYDKWYNVLLTFTFKKDNLIALRDCNGRYVELKLTKKNVYGAIRLARILTRIGSKFWYLDKDLRLVLRLPENYLDSFNIEGLLERTSILDTLSILSMLIKMNGKLSRKGSLILIDFDELKWYVRPYVAADIIGGPLLPYVPEPKEYKWFTRALSMRSSSRDEAIFVDVGAYVGGYSIRACKSNARVIAIEADPTNCEILRKNLELNQCLHKAHIVNIAVSDRAGAAPLYDSASPDTYSLKALWK